MSRYQVVVRVWPREGVADPQGATIERSLPALGFRQVFQVRTGKCFSFVVEADDEAGAEAQAADLCDRFLTNPVIEQYDLALSATVAPVP